MFAISLCLESFGIPLTFSLADLLDYMTDFIMFLSIASFVQTIEISFQNMEKLYLTHSSMKFQIIYSQMKIDAVDKMKSII